MSKRWIVVTSVMVVVVAFVAGAVVFKGREGVISVSVQELGLRA